MSRKGIEDGRAAFAYECVKAAINNKDISEKDYKSHIKKIPMLIKTNGLGNTLAFMLANSKRDYEVIGNDLLKWFKNSKSYLFEESNQDIKNTNFKISDCHNLSDFVELIINKNSQQYRAITVETFTLFNWLKRFSDGLIEGE